MIMMMMIIIIIIKIHPRTGHEASKSTSSTLCLTSALVGGWVVNATPWPLYYWEWSVLPIVLEGGRTQGRSDRVRKMWPYWDSIPELSSQEQVTIPTTLSQSTNTAVTTTTTNNNNNNNNNNYYYYYYYYYHLCCLPHNILFTFTSGDTRNYYKL
jgi:hypothetical protein